MHVILRANDYNSRSNKELPARMLNEQLGVKTPLAFEYILGKLSSVYSGRFSATCMLILINPTNGDYILQRHIDAVAEVPVFSRLHGLNQVIHLFLRHLDLKSCLGK